MILTVAIPAYNRPRELLETLQSIAPELGTHEAEILVCEDRSPQATQIAESVRQFQNAHPHLRVTFSHNAANLGYDGNLRRLLELAKGDHVMFFGDDDLAVPGGIGKLITHLQQHSSAVVLRAWSSFDTHTGKQTDTHHYFPGSMSFSPGVETAANFFRKCVFISGLTVNRAAALALHTDRFDGTLLYQLYLAGELLQGQEGYYLNEVIATRRSGGEHFFGSAEAEKAHFSPKQTTPQHSLKFVSGLFRIASDIDSRHPGFKALVTQDVGRYAYPLMSIQAPHLSKVGFIRYCLALSRLGPGREPLFWVYMTGLLVLGTRVCDAGIAGLKRLLGSTPRLSGKAGKSRTA
ncbi:MAG: glycosyltransferase family 2 protein [Pseudomonadota bacterium]